MGKETLRIISRMDILALHRQKRGASISVRQRIRIIIAAIPAAMISAQCRWVWISAPATPDWQYHDLELMLAAREQGVPMIIGSAGDTGTKQPR